MCPAIVLYRFGPSIACVESWGERQVASLEEKEGVMRCADCYYGIHEPEVHDEEIAMAIFQTEDDEWSMYDDMPSFVKSSTFRTRFPKMDW